MRVPFKKFISLFRNLDLYGIPVNLLINKKTKFQSNFGALVSVGIMCIVVYVIFLNVVAWLNNDNLKIISSNKNYSVTELFAKNMSMIYNLNHDNYYIYFAPYLIYPNGSRINYQSLSPYFSFKYYYTNSTMALLDLESEKCSVQQMDVFLKLSEETINLDKGKVSQWGLCIKNPLQMGLFTDPIKRVCNRTSIVFKVLECVNSTQNFNSCAPQNQIDDAIKYLEIQATIPKTFFDFQNKLNPKEEAYDYQYFHLDKNQFKRYTNNLLPISLNTDYGKISPNYRLDSIDFITDSLIFEPKVRTLDDDEELFRYEIMMGFNTQSYYRESSKLNDLAGIVGGVINVLFMIGKIICVLYNAIYMKYVIINQTFSFLPNEKKKQNMSESTLQEKSKLKFSFKNYITHICSHWRKQKQDKKNHYTEAMKGLHEYMDIKNVVQRLQDFDKLKLILLNENQRKLFECIPRPNIQVELKHQNVLTLDSLIQYKNLKHQKEFRKNLFKSTKFMFDSDPLTKKIVELLDPPMKEQLEDILKQEEMSPTLSPIARSPKIPSLINMGFTQNLKPSTLFTTQQKEESEIPEENIKINMEIK